MKQSEKKPTFNDLAVAVIVRSLKCGNRKPLEAVLNLLPTKEKKK